ncbi:MAG: cell division protein CrgA [Actinomycetota bacterium]
MAARIAPLALLSAAMPKSRSKRVTAKPPKKAKVPHRSSNDWVGALFFTLLAAGVIAIVANYVGAFGETSNANLWMGLGLIAAAFVVATRWH